MLSLLLQNILQEKIYRISFILKIISVMNLLYAGHSLSFIKSSYVTFDAKTTEQTM